jgi:phosphoribosylanthranilate isomerase
VTWVKVCGLSRRTEVETAVAAGADAVGFVTVAGSPRELSLEQVAELSVDVPVRRVLLTADLAPERLLEVAGQAGVDGVQPYGRHSVAAATAAAAAGLFVLHPLRVRDSGDLERPARGATALYDTHRGGRYGGTGEIFDWSRLDEASGDYVVAGGLGPDNVGDLVQRVHPWGVDASSGLESRPGVKDLGKVTAFVEEAKRA